MGCVAACMLMLFASCEQSEVVTEPQWDDALTSQQSQVCIEQLDYYLYRARTYFRQWSEAQQLAFAADFQHYADDHPWVKDEPDRYPQIMAFIESIGKVNVEIDIFV